MITMSTSQTLTRARELAKKTNVTVMVVNETTDEVFVIMNLDEYEKLLNKQQTTNNLRPTTTNK